jgi:ABC-type multidrug transport system fused ATPase/permease subunit
VSAQPDAPPATARLFDRRLLALALTQWRPMSAAVVLGIVVSAATVGESVLLSRALAAVFEGRTVASTLPLVAGAVLLVAVDAVAIAQGEGAAAAASVRIAGRLRERLFRRMLELGPGWAGGQRSGELRAVMVDTVEQLDNYFRRFVARILVAGLTATSVIVAILVIDPIVGAITAAFAILLICSPAAEYRALGQRFAFWSSSYRPLSAEFVDNLNGMATLKAFGAAGHRGQELRRKADGVRDAAIRITNLSGVYWGFMSLVSGAGVAVGLFVGALRVANGQLSGASLLLILFLSTQCFRPAREIHDALHLAAWGTHGTWRAFAVLDARPPVADPDVPPPTGPAGSVEAEHVRFRYRPGAQPAIEDVDLQVGTGRTVALVGRSGAGKTTMASLLLRFFDPERGAVRAGGYDVEGVPLAWLRDQVAVVPQDTFLFHASVRDNLRLARPEATDAELEAAAAVAGALGFVERLPAGWETLVGDRGVKLSGGQRQRLAIARALLRDTPILLLDEATSSVDVASEAAIQTALDSLAEGRARLVIAHRLSTVRGANLILVLDHGRVVEAGTHDELVAMPGGTYARLLASQAADR